MVHWYVRDNGYGLTIVQVNPLVKEVYDYVMMSFGSNGCFVISTPCLNGGYDYDFASNMGHLRLDSVWLLVYVNMRTISEAPVLYYRSLGTASILPRMD
jgi:hypothetical protein